MTEQAPVLVRDLMTVGVATCPPDAVVREIAQLFIEKGLEALVVLDGDEGHALGIISQEELACAYSRPNAGSLRADAVMREGVPQVPPNIPLEAAAQIMRDQGVRCLFLMHHSAGIEYPAAFLSYQHLIRHLAAENAGDLRDLGIHAERQSPIEIFIQRREAARKSRSKPE